MNVVSRIERHNQHFYKGSSTAKANDWELKLELIVIDRKSALKVESYIKGMKSNVVHKEVDF